MRAPAYFILADARRARAEQGPYGKQPIARRALVVCPATLVKNWQNEFKRWLGDERVRTFALDHDSPDVGKFINSTIYSVLIVGYEKFRNLTKELRAAKMDLAIFDEGHKLKNANVKISQAIREIPTRRRILLTGTPIQVRIYASAHLACVADADNLTRMTSASFSPWST